MPLALESVADGRFNHEIHNAFFVACADRKIFCALDHVVELYVGFIPIGARTTPLSESFLGVLPSK